MVIFLNRIRQIFWIIVAIGMSLPWLVGIAVKLYLSMQGKPTFSLSYFLNIGSILLLIPVTIWWALPFIGLAYLSRNLLYKPIFGLQSYVARLVFILCGLLGGCIGEIIVFTGVFEEFDPMIFFIPVWRLYFPYMLGGLVVGFYWGIQIKD
jgi:hypothetical protein